VLQYQHYLMRWTALSDHNVTSDATNSDAVWIEKLAVVLPTRAKVKLEHSVTIKHLTVTFITQSIIYTG